MGPGACARPDEKKGGRPHIGSIMRTTKKTIVRRDHDRRQRCGPGLRDVRVIRIGETGVTLQRNDVDQLGLLDASAPPTAPVRSCPRKSTRCTGREDRNAEPIRYSYWRNQPCGPRSQMRKLILVDVRA